MTATILEHDTDQRVVTDPAPSTDKADQAHIVMVPPDQDDETPQAYVMRARVEGFAITALCGFVWIPNKSAQGLTVCPDCKAIFEHDPHGKGDRGELPDE